MKRWLPLSDLIFWPSMALVCTVLCTLGLIFTDDVPPQGVVLGILVPVSMWGFVVGVIYKRWTERPTFVIMGGCFVWTNDQPIEEHMLHVVIEHVAKKLEEWGVADEKDVIGMFTSFRIEFTKKPIRWGGNKYCGLQSGHSIRVWWDGGFKENAFMHEVLHAVRENILVLPRDYQHADKEYWALDAKLKGSFTA